MNFLSLALEEKHLVTVYRTLSPRARRALLELLEALAEDQDERAPVSEDGAA